MSIAAPAVRGVAVERHLNCHRPFLVTVEREASKERVGREHVGVHDAPARVRQMLVHRAEDTVDLRRRSGGDLVGVVLHVPLVRRRQFAADFDLNGPVANDDLLHPAAQYRKVDLVRPTGAQQAGKFVEHT
jgi:hypothetical protein